MSALPLLCALLALPALEVDIAPDQPIAQVYVDDPLIIEITASEDALADVRVEVQGSRPGREGAADLTGVVLRAGGSRWCAFDSLPRDRDTYQTTVQITVQGEMVRVPGVFCRVDRPGMQLAIPLSAADTDAADARVALRTAGIRTVRVDAALPDAADRVAALTREGFRVVARLNAAEGVSAGEMAQRLAPVCASIGRWEIYAGDNAESLDAAAHAVRDAACTGAITAVVHDAAALRTLLERGAGAHAHAATLNGGNTAALSELQGIGQLAGFEEFPVRAHAAGWGAGADFIKNLLSALAAGAERVSLDTESLYDGGVRETLAYVSGLSYRLTCVQPAGALVLGKGVQAPVFRQGPHWFVPVWTDGAPASITLPAGGAANLVLTDALNNSLPVPAADGEQIPLTVDGHPQYLSGTGGAVLAAAARTRAREAARILAASEAHAALIGPEVMDVVRRAVAGEITRVDFFALLRVFPEIERRWHAGQIPQGAAVPALTQLARLARALCTLEEDRATPFLEPLQDTLARCEEFQSLYLTASVSSGQGYSRGDWLLNAVRGLLDESEELAAGERKIEATAVAIFAEWRARALEYAAKARPLEPLSDTVSVPPPPPPAAEAAPAPPPSEPKPAAVELTAAPPPAPAKPQPLEPGQPKGTRKVEHTVARGETPAAIAKKYGVRVEDFSKWNGLRQGATLRAGRVYTVYLPVDAPQPPPAAQPAPVAPAPPAAPADAAAPRTIRHKVAQGDSPYTIAKKYGVDVAKLLEWNKLTKRSVLHIGDELVVHLPAQR